MSNDQEILTDRDTERRGRTTRTEVTVSERETEEEKAGERDGDRGMSNDQEILTDRDTERRGRTTRTEVTVSELSKKYANWLQSTRMVKFEYSSYYRVYFYRIAKCREL